MSTRHRTEFFISVGVLFYLFVSLNYPILDVLVNPVRAANSSLESHYNLKSEDLLLSYAIKTHKWNVQSSDRSVTPVKSAIPQPIQKAKPVSEMQPLPEVLPPFPPSVTKISPPTSSKPLTESKPPLTIHVVKPGDTLWKIAAKYGVSSASISKLNQLKESDILSVGMKLKVSGGS